MSIFLETSIPIFIPIANSISASAYIKSVTAFMLGIYHKVFNYFLVAVYMSYTWWILLLQALIGGIVAGVVLYTLQVIWEIRRDYLILKDKIEKLEKQLNNRK